MSGQREIARRLMNEQVECGGQLYTRKQLFDELIAEGHPHKCVDAFVFGYLKTAHPTEQAEQIGTSDQPVTGDSNG